MVVMADPRPVFPLRLRSERLRALLREVAEREHVSQNELIEQALEHEVVARGALLAEDLATSARRLSLLSAQQRSELIERSISEAGEAEGLPEPIRARAVRMPGPASAPAPEAPDHLGVLAAFESARQ